MKRHISNTRAQLGELHGLATETEAAERRILAQAESRLEQVNAMIERQRPGIDAATKAGQDRYTALVQERGQLQTIIAKARDVLGL